MGEGRSGKVARVRGDLDQARDRRSPVSTRTLAFAHNGRAFIKRLPRTLTNVEDARQLTRASGSVGANYIEANESLSKRDFVMRAKICRKEAKEARYWLRLMDTGTDPAPTTERDALVQEATELTSIFGA